jgi:hypothetical protein
MRISFGRFNQCFTKKSLSGTFLPLKTITGVDHDDNPEENAHH